jgi:hypothetical protein
MPCNDITEKIRIVLDRNDRLISYRLFKKTCGSAVGEESLLSDSLTGLGIDDILLPDKVTSYGTKTSGNQIERFLNLKHLLAIRAVLLSFTGRNSAGVDDTCTMAGISYDGGDTIIDAEINIGLITEQIEACSHCGPV